jgi:hypothetical protein
MAIAVREAFRKVCSDESKMEPTYPQERLGQLPYIEH